MCNFHINEVKSFYASAMTFFYCAKKSTSYFVKSKKEYPSEKNIWLFSALGETVSNLSEFKRDKHLLTQVLVLLLCNVSLKQHDGQTVDEFRYGLNVIRAMIIIINN